MPIHVRHLAGGTRGEGFDDVRDMVITLLDAAYKALPSQ
jgi:hypothetical protein